MFYLRMRMERKTTLENPSAYELADDLEDPSEKLVEKDSDLYNEHAVQK